MVQTIRASKFKDIPLSKQLANDLELSMSLSTKAMNLQRRNTKCQEEVSAKLEPKAAKTKQTSLRTGLHTV